VRASPYLCQPGLTCSFCLFFPCFYVHYILPAFHSSFNTSTGRLCVHTFTGFLLTSESSSNRLLVFKCQHQMAPPYLASMCVQLSADTRSRQLRSAARNDLLIPRTRTASYGPRSFAVSDPTCWNSLPPQVMSASLTLLQFCDRLKTILYCFLVVRSRGHKFIIDTVTGFYSISNYGNYGNAFSEKVVQFPWYRQIFLILLTRDTQTLHANRRFVHHKLRPISRSPVCWRT